MVFFTCKVTLTIPMSISLHLNIWSISYLGIRIAAVSSGPTTTPFKMGVTFPAVHPIVLAEGHSPGEKKPLSYQTAYKSAG